MTLQGSSAGNPRDPAAALNSRFAIIAARFNSEVTDPLIEGAKRAFTTYGANPGDIEVMHVPGAWELPQAAAAAVRAGEFDAIVALGCVIRGETPPFDYVCMQASLGLGTVASEADIPVAFGVLTTDDLQQALARAGMGPDNKGFEAAVSVLDMVAFYRHLGAI